MEGKPKRDILVLVGALLAASVCFQVVPGDSLVGSLVQGVLLAGLAVGAVALCDRKTLALRRRASGEHCGLRWVTYVLAVGLVAGVVAAWRVESAAATDGSLVARVVAVVLICLLTGVFEEGIFRATALRAFASAFEGGRAPMLKAALASSVLFGLLHVSAADAVAAGSAVAWAQVVCKPLQAALFGLVMAALFIRTRSLWAASLTHGLFNMVYVGPPMLLAGIQTTYVTGDPFDLALLAATTLLLIPPAIASCRELLLRTQDSLKKPAL